MTPSLDFDVSNLLCDEDKDCISYDVGDDFKGLDGDIDQSHNESMIPETEHSVLDLHLQNDEYLTLLTVKESEQFVGFVDYFNKLNNQNLFLVARQEAVNWFSKVHAQFNFGPLCAYLSVNYLDRFLAIYELPNDKPWMMQLLAVTCLSLAAKMEETEIPLILDLQNDKPWMMQLLAVTCLSLAAKMEETEIPLILDLQAGGSRFVFEPKTIQRTELIVLSRLKWRMQSVTPFSFIDSFIRKLNDFGQSQTNSRSLISKSSQLMLCLINGIDFLEFQPSEIAAAVAIYVVGIEVKTQISALFEHAKKGRVFKCMEVVRRGCTMNFGSGMMTSLFESPIGV